jgi:hypothetical protein
VDNVCYLSIQSFVFLSPLKELQDKNIQNHNLTCCFYVCESLSLTQREEQRLRVFENRVVLRRIYETKREEVVGGWRRLHNEELHNLYASESIIGVINSRMIKWAGHAVCMGVIRKHTKFCVENPKGRNCLEKLGIDRKIMLE